MAASLTVTPPALTVANGGVITPPTVTGLLDDGSPAPAGQITVAPVIPTDVQTVAGPITYVYTLSGAGVATPVNANFVVTVEDAADGGNMPASPLPAAATPKPPYTKADKDKQLAMVTKTITNNNPRYNEVTQRFDVSNDLIGTQSVLITFGIADKYPQWLLDMLAEQKCMIETPVAATSTVPAHVKRELKPEYTIA